MASSSRPRTSTNTMMIDSRLSSRPSGTYVISDRKPTGGSATGHETVGYFQVSLPGQNRSSIPPAFYFPPSPGYGATRRHGERRLLREKQLSSSALAVGTPRCVLECQSKSAVAAACPP